MSTVRLPRRARALVAAGAAALSLALAPSALVAQEAGDVTITTPYPSVAVEPGETATFDLEVIAPTPTQVDIDIDVPGGWSALLRGGGFIIGGVLARPEEPPVITLEVDVPADADEGDYEVVVRAGGGELPLSLRIAEAAGGTVALTAEFSTLQGGSDRTFPFTLTLENDTPAETTFSLSAQGPPGWVVSARPQNEQLATTVTVAGGETATVTVDADPPDDVPAGTYPIAVLAEGGGQVAQAELLVDITGNFAMTLTTPEERLNAEVEAGSTTDVALLVVNDGTAPLQAVTLTGTPPEGWEVTFEPEVIESVEPGGFAEVTARLTAAGDALAGDYLVTFSANAGEGEATDDVEIRTTVQTSAVFGILGVALIGIAFLVLIAVFRRFGRR